MSYMIFIRAGVWIDRLAYKNIFFEGQEENNLMPGSNLHLCKEGSGFYILLAGNSPAPQARHVTSCSRFTMLFSPSTSTEKKLTLTEKTPLPSSSSRSLTKRGLLQTAQPPPSPPSSLPLPLCPPLPRCAGVLASSSISAFHLPSLDAAAR